jgi:hypothetical protein
MRSLISRRTFTAAAIDEDWANAAYEVAVSSLVDELERGRLRSPRLIGGLAGAGFVLSHVSAAGAADEILERIDER